MSWSQVLPRSSQDLNSAFIVLAGSVKVYYGNLGQHIVTHARGISSRKAEADRQQTASMPQSQAEMTSFPLLHRGNVDVADEQIAAVRTCRACNGVSASINTLLRSDRFDDSYAHSTGDGMHSLRQKSAASVACRTAKKRVTERRRAHFLDPAAVAEVWDDTIAQLKRSRGKAQDGA